MSKLLNAMKEKFIHLKQNVMLRTVLICVLALLLIFSVTLAWYINNLGMWGMEFNTGTIDFKAYIYSEDGTKLAGPIAPDDDDLNQYLNAPLATIEDAQVGSLGTVYIALESCGSIGIDYRIAFDITGKSDKATAYLGGYKYNVSKVTDKVAFNGSGNINVSNCPRPDRITDEIVTIDRNAVNGSIPEKNGYDIYRFDYTLVHKNEEYTGSSIKIYFNVFATQVGGDFEDTEERGYTYYCATREDLDRAKVEAYPGDVIKLTSNIIYYGDLVFNKPINLETNDFTLTVNGNLMYDYVLGNSLKLDAGGLGRIIVQCTKEGVGGNFKIKAPLSDVTITGSNASIGDIVVEKIVSVDASNAFGSPGVSFNNIRIVDEKNSRKTILLASNTRATVAFGTTIGLIQSDVKANNIEIINNGVIGDINLSSMEQLEQTNSPQIYILNNHIITNPISLPTWSVKFVDNGAGVCTGNTRIIQSYSGSQVSVVGNCPFKNSDIEIEVKDSLVEQIEEGNDSRLKIYYQDVDGEVTSIQSILENYMSNEATTDCAVNEILQLEIISIDDKAITNDDIAYMNSAAMLALEHLDMHRAIISDTSQKPAVKNKLYDNAFNYVSKYETLVLPQTLEEIGMNALSNTQIDNYVVIPSGVETYGTNWFQRSKYVSFASSVPDVKAVSGMGGVHAIFVDEPYIASYKDTFSSYRTRIYPLSVLDENQEHFVRNLGKDEWEITYFIGGDDPIIGDGITIDGTILNIVSVYDYAYLHNYNEANVVFDDTVLNVGMGNFQEKRAIVSVDLNNVKTLGNNVFFGCTNLRTVDFGNQLETIGSTAFRSCTSLNTDVVLPDTMKKIGESAFEGTPITGLYAGGTTEMDAKAFLNCSKLIVADLPNLTTVNAVGNNDLFCYCGSLVSVSIPSINQVNGGRMFGACTSLREVYMGERNDSINLGSSPFFGVSASLKMYVPEEHLEFYCTKRPGNVVENRIYPIGEKMGEELVNGFNIGQYIVLNNGDNSYSLVTSNISHSGKYSIPTTYQNNPITKIYRNCFRNQSFTEVTLTLGNNLKEIGSFAFYGLNGLDEIIFGKSLERIGESAFANCTNIGQDLVLPDSMIRIDDSAFRNSGILSVNTGGTTEMGSYVFNSCGSLVYAVMPNVTVVAEGGSNEAFAYSRSLVSVDMPKLSTASGTKMFSYCTSMREVIMGSKSSNVTLGDMPFRYGAAAGELKLYVPEDALELYRERKLVDANAVYPRGEKVGTQSVNGFVIGDYIVLKNDDGYTLVTSNLEYTGDVTALTEYKGQPITEIFDHAFRNQQFTDVNLILGDEVKRIGRHAFNGLTGLQSIKMDGVTSVEAYVFYGSGLQVLNGPQITSVGEAAFRNCKSLTTVNLPLIVNLSGTDAFRDCSKLKSIYFENVMSIVNTAFTNCLALEKFVINKQIEPGGANIPQETKIDNNAKCSIYVPYRSLSEYEEKWSNKPVVSFDIAVTDSGDTYILSEVLTGRYMLIDYVPSKSNATLTMPASFTYDGANVSIYSIASGAFTSVTGTLKDITLSSTVGEVQNGALTECGSLENIYVHKDNRYYTSVNGVLYSRDAKMLVKYPAGRSGKFDMSTGSYSTTIGIASGAFGSAVKLTEIVFPASLKVIDGAAFTNCTKLHTVQFTGNTPPVLMGTGIFDTKVDGFKMVIPTTSASVVTAYLSAYNFGEYEPYISTGSYTAPDASAERNKVTI